jgi:hypothetical protein
MHCLNDTHSPPLFQLVTHPTLFWTSGTTASLLWLSCSLQMLQYFTTYRAFLCNRDAMPQLKWGQMCPIHTVCPPAKHIKKRLVCNYDYMKVLHIMGNHCSAQSQHKFHPRFYSNAFPLSQMLRLSLHATALDMNLSIRNFCY